MTEQKSKTIVLDMHGVLYTHVPDFDIQKSSERIRQEIARYDQDYPDFGKSPLDVEWDSVLRGREDRSFLQIYFFPQAIEKTKEFFEMNNTIIICANARMDEQKFIVDELVEKAGFEFPLAEIDLYDFSEYGKKDDSAAWLEIFQNYQQIDEVYEDKEENLEAVRAAAKQCGFKDTIFKTSL
jgi:hypothetical protein